MQTATRPNEEQAMYWNGVGGEAWVDMQTVLDDVLAAFTSLLMQGVQAASIDRLLDIGCGAGATTLAAAKLLREGRRCVGIDISEPLIAAARARAARENLPATFICADAATYAFEPASIDMLISRFGLMFFDEPVQAFSSLRRAAKTNAEIRFVAWRSPTENPFMTAAERAARPFLPSIPDRDADAPGQFAFADSRRVLSILQNAGWSSIDIRPIDVDCAFPQPELFRYFTKLGPLGRVLHEAAPHVRIELLETVRAAFDPYVFGAQVPFTAACWLVSARA